MDDFDSLYCITKIQNTSNYLINKLNEDDIKPIIQQKIIDNVKYEYLKGTIEQNNYDIKLLNISKKNISDNGAKYIINVLQILLYKYKELSIVGKLELNQKTISKMIAEAKQNTKINQLSFNDNYKNFIDKYQIKQEPNTEIEKQIFNINDDLIISGNNNKIIIKNKPENNKPENNKPEQVIDISISTFLIPPSKSPTENNFINFQKSIRYYDYIKDGSIEPSIKSIIETNIKKKYIEKKNIEKKESQEKFFNENLTFYNNNNIANIDIASWSSRSNYNLDKKVISTVAEESGLDPTNFIELEKYFKNLATDIIDPLKRQHYNNTTFFPVEEKNIFIDESFFKLFGFNNVKLNVKLISKYDYDFSININDFIIDKNNYQEYFIGNTQKNSKIKEINQTNNTAVDKIEIYLIAKELGDLMQVIFLYIWKQINNLETNYIISTCDKVVYIMCQILNVNCSYYNIDSRTRFRNIQYFFSIKR